jgi:DNA polymerase-3 subunit beta
MTTLTVTGAALHDAAAWASRITPARPTVPVLSGLLLDATGDDLQISAFDYDTRVSVRVPAVVREPGRLLVSARLLAAIAKTVARQVDVHITDDSGAIALKCGRSDWQLPALPVAEYPNLPQLGDPVGAVNAGRLRHALSRVLPAVAKEGALPALSGVHLEADSEHITLVATDRYRLAAARIPWSPTVDQPFSALLPAQLLDLAVRAHAGNSETIGLHHNDSGFGVSTDTHLVTGRLVDAEYVRWRQVMPAGNPDHRAVVDTAGLAQAMEQALVAVQAEPQLLLTFDDGEVEVSAAGDDRSARSATEVDLIGDPITVKVNAGYLRDALNTVGCTTVTLHFGSTPTRPILVTGDDVDDYQHCVVPVRLLANKAAA